ncbi:MAG: hypothetical protein KGL39_13655 [Patescibacteria group bacterium]|nr:hypothetical protein [Patescibacteria group bacterium]
MQDIYFIAKSLDAVMAHRRCGTLHHHIVNGVVYAVCEPVYRGARAELAADSALTVLPSLGNSAPIPTALVAVLPTAISALPTDTTRSLLARLHAAGVSIFDPEV